MICRKQAGLDFGWVKTKFTLSSPKHWSKTTGQIDSYYKDFLLVLNECLTGIYGNVGLHKNYLKSKFSTLKKTDFYWKTYGGCSALHGVNPD